MTADPQFHRMNSLQSELKHTSKIMPFPNQIVSSKTETISNHQHTQNWNNMSQNNQAQNIPQNPNNNITFENNSINNNNPLNMLQNNSNNPMQALQLQALMNLNPEVIQIYLKQMGLQVNSIPNLNNGANINMGSNPIGPANVPNFQTNQVTGNPFNNSGDTSNSYKHNNTINQIQTELPSNANSVKTVHKQENKIVG